MSIEAISRFNGGNGGVSIVITKDSVDFDGGEGHHEIGEFLNPTKAIEFGIEVLRKAYASMNQEFPTALEEDIKRNAGRIVRLVFPVKVK